MDDQLPTCFDRLNHVSHAAGMILKFCENVNEKEFIGNEMLNNSVLYQFIIIGDAIQYVDAGILKKYPYKWHLPRSFRNYAAHEYFGINLSQVYKTIRELLPEFKILIDKIIEEY